MGIKLKVSVVMGIPDNPCILDLLQPLRSNFDLTVYSLENANSLNQYRSAIDLKVFPNIRDMPGYMRGIEDALQNSDIILGIENFQLSSFQAVRAGVKFNKPTAIICGGTQVFYYNDYPNIKAIQSDINSHANLFIYTSQAAKQTLLADGVAAEKMHFLAPTIDTSRMPFVAQKRDKFRRYIGTDPQDVLVLFYDDLLVENKPVELVNALKVLKQKNSPLFQKLKILYAGNGQAADQLKYYAVDQGLGRNLMFLHQNPDPFIHDLMCASDAIAVLATNRQTAAGNPGWILQAVSCGVKPFLTSSSVESEWLAPVGCLLASGSAAEIALAFERDLNGDLAAIRQDVHMAAEKLFVANKSCSEFEIMISRLWKSNQFNNASSQSIQDQLNLIEDCIGKDSDLSGSLVMLEDFQLRYQNQLWTKPHILRLRGEIAFRQNKYDAATDCFAECTAIDSRNAGAFLRLAQIAYANHANEESLTFYRKVLAIDGNNYGALFGVGLIHRRVGLTDEALYWFSKCVTVDSNNPKGLTALSQTCFEAHQVDNAIELLNRVREAVGDQTSIVLALGQLHIKCGNIEEGNDLLKLAIKDNTKMTGT